MKRRVAVLFTIMMLSLTCACGQGDEQTEGSDANQEAGGDAGTDDANPSSEDNQQQEEENQKGTRSNPYAFTDEIEIVSKDQYAEDDVIVEYTIKLSELWGSDKVTAEYPDYRLEDRIIARGQILVNCDATDDAIDFGLTPKFITSSLNEEPAWFETYKSGELNNDLSDVYSGGTYDVIILGGNDGVGSMDLSYLKIEYYDADGNDASVWIELPDAADGAPSADSGEGMVAEDDQIVEEGSYEICPDLEIVASTVIDGDVHVVVKNTGETLIRDYTLAYVGYDVSGNVMELGYNSIIYDTCKFDTANIMPGSTHGLTEYGHLRDRDVKYIDTLVTSITYEDGSEWNTGGLDAWAKDVSERFSIENYNQKIEDMASDAALAESNPYISITNSSKEHTNQFSSNDDLSIDAENIGDKAIKGFSALVMQYDANGYAVENSFDFVLPNCTMATVETANLEPGSSNGWGWSLFFFSDCSMYDIIIYKIEFMDGTTWENEYALQWMLYNEDMRD